MTTDSNKLILNYNLLRSRVLNFVSHMQIGPINFKMGENLGESIYSSCFALYIFNLFDQVASWSQEDCNRWINYINSFQDKDSGFFIPEDYRGDLNLKPVHQLTAFCLSALDIFGASPKYALKFLNQWQTSEEVKNYLKDRGCLDGLGTSGNTAMFLAIFFTYQYEKTREARFLNLINTWFNLHDRTQNPRTGFWGNFDKTDPFLGFQNGLHQFVIYNYWKRPIQYNQQIVDAVLNLQDPDGFFAPYPGGGGCYDYDAAHILISCGYKRNYRTNDIKKTLLLLKSSILENQNEDGGFCETRKRPSSIIKTLSPDTLKFIFSNPNFYITLYKLKTTIRISRQNIINNHWTRIGRRWDQSDMWDTWFRCLTIAEISQILSNNSTQKYNWKFLKTIGLGWYDNSKFSDTNAINT